MKKSLVVLLSVLMVCSLFVGCGKKKAKDDVTVRVGALSGPTAMGLVKLMSDSEEGKTEGNYSFADLSSDPSTFVAPLANGEIDIAAVPSNLASVIYNKTDGGIMVLAINTLGVLNIVERGNEISSVADLKGKKIYATGEGATPEYTLRHLLTAAGLDPDKDVDIAWCADTTEALAYIQGDSEAIAMLPQPFVTVAMTKVDDLRVAIDFNDAWALAGEESDIVTGVLVVRTEFAKEHPEALETFMDEYKSSCEFAQTNVDETAELIAKYEILPKPELAKKALPGCSQTYLVGEDMKNSLHGYLEILFNEDPTAIGGSLPGDDFYYGL